ncbi:ABC transporter substrate-binding protein [Herbiconiux ginsengi]|uniref:Peptide/nickel transport system substrate-binding protein n=1 Tax=Herbiconiux ginsengi TaxID=381665 RepID=A0A1H3LRD1_9MICO|nr:ABC transporter substrate-binding protein [Herbiconiux ginsengi]SDY66518.1 peptide/nickel transport system substrate-binding protein [Herbiconiux ginsengi]
MSNSRSRLRGIAALAAISAGMLVLAGCTGTSEPAATGTSSTAPDLALAAVSGPNSLDPAQLVDGQQMYVWASLYDTLLARDSATGDLVPNAAESWEYNDDGTELTLVLRDDMTFSNGDPVTADAVVATMKRTIDTPGIVQPRFSLVTDVTAVDDHTVKVSFSAYDAQFLYLLALGAGAIGDPATLDDPAIATNPVGSGPYTLDVANTVPGTTYVLDKRDDYWNADAYPFPKVTVRVLPDPTASFNALQAGEINASTVNAQLVGQLDSSTFTVTDVPAQAVAYLDVLDRAGATWPALGDQRVRQAINYAIDREGILKGIYSGDGQTTEQIFNPSGDVYDESLNGTYDYDPAKGKALVEEAGYAGQSFKIPSTFLTTSIEPTLSQAFTDIGLNLEWVAVPPQQAQSALLSGEYGLTFQITGFNSDPADAFTHYSENGDRNPQHYTDATLDKLFGTINTTVDFDQAVPTYKELNQYAVDQAWEAPIVFVGGNWATADGIGIVNYGGAPATIRTFSYDG